MRRAFRRCPVQPARGRRTAWRGRTPPSSSRRFRLREHALPRPADGARDPGGDEGVGRPEQRIEHPVVVEINSGEHHREPIRNGQRAQTRSERPPTFEDEEKRIRAVERRQRAETLLAFPYMP